MARSKKKFDDTIKDLDLVPIMNLMVCLIPMILAGASQVKIGVVNVNAPKFGIGAAETSEDDEKPLNLTVAVAEDGFRLSASGADINSILGLEPAVPSDPAAPPVTGPFLKKKGDAYDYADLYSKLVVVKDKFPDETILNLTADSKIPFKHLINVMDVIRLRLEGSSFDDLEALQSAELKKSPDGTPELLWPDVVFAVAQ